MNPKVQRQPAYVLHRRAYRETSAILELFTRDFGRVAGVLRGARGAKRSSPIEPFVGVEVSWTGRAALRTITGIEATRPRTLSGTRLFAGLYVNELLVRCLSAEEPLAVLFEAYERVVAALATEAAVEPVLRVFEKDLLRCIGYEVVFDLDASSGEMVEDARLYVFVDGEGMCPSGLEAAHAVTGANLKSIQRDDYANAAVRRDAKRLLRSVLKTHLGETPLKTRELFRR